MTATAGEVSKARLFGSQTRSVGTEVPDAGLRLGLALITWGETSDGRRTLEYRGRTLAEQPRAQTGPAFAIAARWSSAETTAVLIEAGQAATTDCATIYVIEARAPDAVASHELGAACVGLKMPTWKRTNVGFAFVELPTAAEPGNTTEWIARTGAVITKSVAFHPSNGRTMAQMIAGKHPQRVEPLTITDFYAAVSRLPPSSRSRAMTALQEVANGCDTCGGTANQELYGIAINDDVAAYSGCGWYMFGAHLHCRDSDALAVWDRRSGRFYFATDEHRGDGIHKDSAELTLEPDAKIWPPAAQQMLAIWRAGGRWPAIPYP